MSVSCNTKAKSLKVSNLVVASNIVTGDNLQVGGNVHVCGDLDVGNDIVANNANVLDLIADQANFNVGSANASLIQPVALDMAAVALNTWVEIGSTGPYLAAVGASPNLVTVTPNFVTVNRTGTWVVSVTAVITDTSGIPTPTYEIGLAIGPSGTLPQIELFSVSVLGVFGISHGASGSNVISLNAGDELRLWIRTTVGPASNAVTFLPQGRVTIYQLSV